jgi:hypothetical protein
LLCQAASVWFEPPKQTKRKWPVSEIHLLRVPTRLHVPSLGLQGWEAHSNLHLEDWMGGVRSLFAA